jgi:hypothetical protein
MSRTSQKKYTRRIVASPLIAAMIILAVTATAPIVRASVYQWSTPIASVISSESKGHPRAFLWIPEHCQRVRAVVIADQNMEEEQIFQDAAFRKTLDDLGFAEVWIAPAMGTIEFRFELQACSRRSVNQWAVALFHFEELGRSKRRWSAGPDHQGRI